MIKRINDAQKIACKRGGPEQSFSTTLHGTKYITQCKINKRPSSGHGGKKHKTQLLLHSRILGVLAMAVQLLVQ